MRKEIVEVYKEDLEALFNQKEYWKEYSAQLGEENASLKQELNQKALEAEIGVLAENKKLREENEHLKKELSRLERFCGGVLKDLVRLESRIDGTLNQSKKYLETNFIDLSRYLDETV